jgi:hypothetical protein
MMTLPTSFFVPECSIAALVHMPHACIPGQAAPLAGCHLIVHAHNLKRNKRPCVPDQSNTRFVLH